MVSPPPMPQRSKARPGAGWLGGLLAVGITTGIALSTGAGCSVLPLETPVERDAAPLPSVPSTASTPTLDAQVQDAGPPPPAYRGNPLCRVKKESCWPDEATSCAAPDASLGGDAGTLEPERTCRVRRDGPACAPVGQLKDGAACTTSAECGPGADCALRADGMGQCRRYCCGGTCEKVNAPAGGASFCDVVQLAEEANVKVPVCMPAKPCKLLSAGQCEVGETCAVVSDEGLTSCLPTGPAQVGESCDEAHCTIGLNCLGRPGARRCFQLCRVGQSACGASLQCKTSSLIRDAAFGICQTP